MFLNPTQENAMKKTLISLTALLFAFIFGAAQAAKHEMPKADPVAMACKDKKPGAEVTVDGKKTKCPEMMKKEEPKKK
jgi:hypothetical protein